MPRLRERHLRQLWTLLSQAGVLVVLAACGVAAPHVLPSSASTDPPVRRILFDELQARSSSMGPLDTLRVRILSEASIAPGRVIHWAVYHPPRTMHVVVTAAAMEDPRSGDASVIRTVTEWARAIGGFIPSNHTQAISACSEAAHLTEPFPIPGAKPRVYSGPEALEDLPLRIGDPDLPARNLSRPVVERRADGGWRVEFWAIGMDDVRQYECTLAATEVSLLVRAILPGSGYLRG